MKTLLITRILRAENEDGDPFYFVELPDAPDFFVGVPHLPEEGDQVLVPEAGEGFFPIRVHRSKVPHLAVPCRRGVCHLNVTGEDVFAQKCEECGRPVVWVEELGDYVHADDPYLGCGLNGAILKEECEGGGDCDPREVRPYLLKFLGVPETTVVRYCETCRDLAAGNWSGNVEWIVIDGEKILAPVDGPPGVDVIPLPLNGRRTDP